MCVPTCNKRIGSIDFPICQLSWRTLEWVATLIYESKLVLAHLTSSEEDIPRKSQRCSIGLKSGDWAGSLHSLQTLIFKMFTIKPLSVKSSITIIVMISSPIAPAYDLTFGSRISSRYLKSARVPPMVHIHVSVTIQRDTKPMNPLPL